MRYPALIVTFLTLATALCASVFAVSQSSPAEKRSITVLPVVAEPNAFPVDFGWRVGTVIATFLEKSGVERLEVSKVVFVPPKTDKVREIADALSRQLREKPIETDFAVFAQLVGTPQSGVSEIRIVVVDQAGKVVLAETANQAELSRSTPVPKDPMTCCLFVSQRLRKLWNLEDPLRPDAPEGKMARFWQMDAGVPDKDELTSIARRAELLKKDIKTATCTVYPVCVGGQSNEQAARDLTALLLQEKLCQAEASAIDPALNIAGHSNQQKVLWDTARAFQSFLRKSPPSSDYAVYVDYGLFEGQARYVHAIVCDRSGDWVLVELQNSHHPNFQQIDPKSVADCHRLLLANLNDWLTQ